MPGTKTYVLCIQSNQFLRLWMYNLVTESS